MEKFFSENRDNQKKLLEKEIINNVFGGKENLELIIKEFIQLEKPEQKKLTIQEIAQLILKNVNTEGYERSDCLRILIIYIWKIGKREQYLKASSFTDNSKKMIIESSRKQWEREAKRAGFQDGSEYRKFLKEN